MTHYQINIRVYSEYRFVRVVTLVDGEAIALKELTFPKTEEGLDNLHMFVSGIMHTMV